MKLIVGLGNPEPKYKRNRHNIGFMLLDYIITHHKSKVCYLKTNDKPLMKLHYSVINNEPMIFLKPQDWMNSSGKSVGRVARELNIPASDIIVVYDDLDLPFGKLRVKHEGSSGGHNGVQSIIDAIGKKFNRVRFGIGRPEDGTSIYDYVLSDFILWEQKQFCELFSIGMGAIHKYIENGIVKTMEVYNRRESNE